jgi:hypothetical protein
MPDHAVLLVAHFGETNEIVPAYRFTRSAGEGGDVYGTQNGTYARDTAVSVTAIAKSGWTFLDWTADGITLSDRANSLADFLMPANDVSLLANFKKDAGSEGGSGSGGGGGGGSGYTVTYDANGGEGGRSISGFSSGDKHTVLTANEAETGRGGYNFTSWNTKPDGEGGTYLPGGVLTVNGHITLYAQWTESGLLETQNHIVYLYGYPSGAAGANRAITRAEVAAVFYRLLANPGDPGAAEDSKRFGDISGGEWYAAEVNRLTALGILKGYPDGSFMPDNPITRAEFSAVASRFDALASVTGNAFVDVPDSHWAVGYVNSAYAHGWIRGYPDGMFKPEAGITRAEVVTIVNAMLDRKIDAAALLRVANPYNDIDAGHWAYADIIEASIAHEYTRDEEGREIWQNP